MVTLAHCALCAELQSTSAGEYDLKGAFITPRYTHIFPTRIPMLVVVMAFWVPWADITGRVLVTTDVVDESGRTILTGNPTAGAFYLQMDISQLIFRGGTVSTVLQTKMENVIFRQPGTYYVIVSLDHAAAARLPIYMVDTTPHLQALNEALQAYKVKQELEAGNDVKRLTE